MPVTKTATFTLHNGLVDITMIWADVLVAQGTEIIENAALYDHRRGLGPTIIDPEEGEIQKPWADLTNQEKLDMVMEACTRLIKAQANTALFDTNIGTAREDTQDYIDTEYGEFE